MANRSHTGPIHLERPNVSEVSVHVDQRVRPDVHVETERPPSPSPQHEGSATNIKELSYANRDIKVEKLREQVALLQRKAEKDKELLCRRDKELYH